MSEPRIRKSLTALLGTDERKGYFYCLKLLGVLPVPPKSGFDNWQFYPPPTFYGFNSTPYTPKCLHDVLIASHATTCEHSSFYFAWYHRNLMVLTELFLNFSHEVLRGGFPKLKAIYPQADFKFLYDQNKIQLWTKVFDVYGELKGIPEQIANHYWNPTDYLSDPDLQIPEEIREKQDLTDPLDVLFFSVCKFYPWQTHVPTRWYQDPSQYNISDLTTVGYLSQTGPSYAPGEKELVQPYLNGNLDPRTSKTSLKAINSFQNNWRGNVLGQPSLGYNSTVVANRNYNSYTQNGQNYTLQSIKPEQSLANFGAKSKNQQYITHEEQTAHNFSRSDTNTFNMALPHFTLAKALFVQNSVINFFDEANIETSHNQMHDYLQFMMEDSSFSVTSFVFWTYHSWIDCQIESWIRRANSQAPNNIGQTPFNSMGGVLSKYTISQTLNNFGPIIPYLGNFFSLQESWNISGGPLASNIAGYYPVFEYMSPDVKPDLQNNQPINPNLTAEAAFSSRDYIITKDNIRTSFQFNDIYQNYYIDQLHPDRFYFLNNIKKYNFNYNYQIGSSPDDLKNILDIKGSNIPKYLADMQGYFIKQAQPRSLALHAAANFSIDNKVTQAKAANKPVPREQVQKVEAPTVKKLFESGISLFVKHSSDIKNGTALVNLKLKNILPTLTKQANLSESELLDLEEYIEKGVNVDRIVIFGKGKGAKRCPRCAKDKIRYRELDESLRISAPLIWKYIHLGSLNEVLYDTQVPDLKVHCIYNKISLVPNKAFSDYRLVGGSEEIEVKVVSHVKSEESQFIRVDAESYSIERDAINNILSKKFYTFNTKFDFYKSFDVNMDKSRAFFDRYVYKVVKGWVSLGTKRTSFSVRLPCFQRLFRLKIDISKNLKGQLRVVVSDADFNVKRQYYREAVKV